MTLEKFENFIKEKEISPEGDPKKFLEFERLTQPNEEIKKIADGLRGKTEQQTLENVLFFLWENLKHIDLEREDPEEWKKLLKKRTAEEILENKISYGCSDTATAFITLIRSCGIPTKYIEGKRIGKSGTHVWGEVFVDGEWKSVDPTQRIQGLEFDPKKVEHGPYVKISESLGPSDSMITSYEDWIRLEKLWDYKKNILKN